MTVKVIIERSINPEMQREAVDLLTDLRAVAMRQQGYVSGETLFAVDRPGTHLVISTWENLAGWHAWENNPERLSINRKIEALLTSPARSSVYETARYVSEGT